MSTLSEKRKFLYEVRNSHNETNLTLGDIDLNTDQLETKLDTLITNTNHNNYTGGTNTTIAGGATETTIASVDLGASSALHKLQVAGTTTHNNIDNVIQVSNDNTNWFDLTHLIVTTVGSKFSAMGNICFRYFRMRTSDNTGSPVTVVVQYSVKNLN